MSTPIQVTGGAGGIDAHIDDLVVLAGALRRAATLLGEIAVRTDLGAALLAEPLTAVVDPVGAAAALAAIVAAADAVGGAGPLAAGAAALAVAVASAAAAYQVVDDVETSAFTQTLAEWVRLPLAAAIGLRVLAASGQPGLAGQAAIGADPFVVDDLVDSLGFGHPGAVAALLGAAYPDGRAVVTDRGVDHELDTAGPPRSVAGLLSALSTRDNDVPGAVDVRVLTTVDADGTVHRRAVVDVPGTKDWSGQLSDPDVANIGTNLRALDGAITAYSAGVVAALGAAGIRAGDQVLFVGHSLGGMVAVTAAASAASQGYTVAGVITAGAPIARIPPPPGVPVVALENAADVVPHLDGAANPAGPDEVTVTLDAPHPRVTENHDLELSYLPVARAVDASTDPSVAAVLAGWAPFFGAGSVSTHVYAVSRSLG